MLDSTSAPRDRAHGDGSRLLLDDEEPVRRPARQPVDAKIIFRDRSGLVRQVLPDHGHQRVPRGLLRRVVPRRALVRRAEHAARGGSASRSTHGCPLDCGACPSHQQKVYLPVVPITSACNLDCPICYTINKNDDAHNMTTEDMAQDPRAPGRRSRRARHHQLHRRRADAAPAAARVPADVPRRRHPPPDHLDQRPQAPRRGLRAQAGRARRAHRPLARHLRSADRQASCSARTR